MTIVQQLQNDLKDSMRARDAERTSTIRMALAACKNEQIELGHELSDPEAEAVLRREVKKRRDAADLYRQAGREETAGQEEREAAVLTSYLPQQLSADELRPQVAALVAELGLSGPGDMGRLMPELLARFKERAEGRTISQVAREVLGRGQA